MRIKYIQGLTIKINDIERIIWLHENKVDDHDQLLCAIPALLLELKELIDQGYVLKV